MTTRIGRDIGASFHAQYPHESDQELFEPLCRAWHSGGADEAFPMSGAEVAQVRAEAAR